MELPVKSVRLSVPSFLTLFETLPRDAQTPELQQALAAAYYRELERLIASAMAPDCLEPQVILHSWRTAGAQQIAEFHVSDLTLPSSNAINFHGQNTSQWRYAGAIVVQNGEVSVHH